MLENMVSTRQTNKHCKLGRLLLTLSEADREILTAALDNTWEWTAYNLSVQLKVNANISISDKLITKHRLGGCSCER